MQVTINIPETLPPAIIKQRIRELEESLQQEARQFASASDKQAPKKSAKFLKLMAIAGDCAQLPTIDPRSADEILGYQQSPIGLWDAE
ncbi:MAG: hypothetical protein HOO92_09590 [Methylococcaceae bacterium]|nr:hypothetical protein [Methylococcaceae bacterium]